MQAPITLVAAALAISSITARADERTDDAKLGPPYFSLSIGWRSATFDPVGHTFDLERSPYRATIARFAGRQLTAMHGDGFYWDMHIHVGRAWYFGSDVVFASGPPPRSEVIASGSDMMTWTGTKFGEAAGVGGAQLPFDRLSLRAEIVAGVRIIDVLSAGAIHAVANEALLEPRIGVNVRLCRRASIEAMGGVNALDHNERELAIGLWFRDQGRK